MGIKSLLDFLKENKTISRQRNVPLTIDFVGRTFVRDNGTNEPEIFVFRLASEGRIEAVPYSPPTHPLQSLPAAASAVPKETPEIKETSEPKACCDESDLIIPEKDLDDVKNLNNQTNVCLHRAWKALQKHNGDFVEALIDLTVN